MKRLFRILPLLVAFVLVGCPDSVVLVESIVLDRTELEIAIGETARLQATVGPADAVDKTVVWSSSDENIVKVDQEGKVTAIAKGSAVITAAANGGAVRSSADVTVYEPAAGISIKMGSDLAEGKIIKSGKSAELRVEYIPAGARATKVIWTSSNENVLTVDENGKVTGISGGTAQVTATLENSGIKTSCNLKVEGFEWIPDIEIMSSMIKTYELAYVSNGEIEDEPTGESLDPYIAAIDLDYITKEIYDENGDVISEEIVPVLSVYGLQSGSTSTILRLNGTELKVKIDVLPYQAESLDWSDDTIYVSKGKTEKLWEYAEFGPKPFEFPYGYVEFSSTNPKFVVDGNGRLTVDSTAGDDETSQITMSCGDRQSRPILVKLNPAPTGIKITCPGDISYEYSSIIPLEYEVLPKGASQEMTVTSTDDLVSYNEFTGEFELENIPTELFKTITIEIASAVDPEVKKSVDLNLYGFVIDALDTGGVEISTRGTYTAVPVTLAIPGTINGRNVEVIGNFNVDNLYNAGLRKIQVPDSVSRIEHLMTDKNDFEIEFSDSPSWNGLKYVGSLENCKLINLKLDADVVLTRNSLHNTGLKELVIPDGAALNEGCLADNPFDKIYIGDLKIPMLRLNNIFGSANGFTAYVKGNSLMNSMEKELNSKNVQIFYGASLEDYQKNDLKRIEKVSFTCDKTEWRPNEFSKVQYEIIPKYYISEDIEFVIENPEIAEILNPILSGSFNLSAKSVGETRVVAKGKDGRELGSFAIKVQ